MGKWKQARAAMLDKVSKSGGKNWNGRSGTSWNYLLTNSREMGFIRLNAVCHKQFVLCY